MGTMKAPSRHEFYKNVAKLEPNDQRSPSDSNAQGAADPHIGRIYLSEISTATKYHLPDEVKTVVRKWMRAKNQVNMVGGSHEARQNFQELCDDLGFSNPAHPKSLRDLCILKATEFIGNEGRKFLKNGQFSYHLDGTREWAGYTDTWLQNDWNGDTTDPKPRGLRLRNPSLHQVPPPKASNFNSPKMSRENLLRLFDVSFAQWEGKDITLAIRHVFDAAIQKLDNDSVRTRSDLVRWLELESLPDQGNINAGSHMSQLPGDVGMIDLAENLRHDHSQAGSHHFSHSIEDSLGRGSHRLTMGEQHIDDPEDVRSSVDYTNDTLATTPQPLLMPQGPRDALLASQELNGTLATTVDVPPASQNPERFSPFNAVSATQGSNDIMDMTTDPALSRIDQTSNSDADDAIRYLADTDREVLNHNAHGSVVGPVVQTNKKRVQGELVARISRSKRRRKFK